MTSCLFHNYQQLYHIAEILHNGDGYSACLPNFKLSDVMLVFWNIYTLEISKCWWGLFFSSRSCLVNIFQHATAHPLCYTEGKEKMDGLVWSQQPRRGKIRKRNTHTHTSSPDWRKPLEIGGLHPAPSFPMLHTHRATSMPAFPSCSGEVITGLTDGAQMIASRGVAITGSSP